MVTKEKRAEYNRTYREKHKDKIKVYRSREDVRGQRARYQRKWSRANPEKAKEIRAKWHKANSKKNNAQSKKWREENPKRWRAITDAWRKANPEKAREMVKVWRKANPEKYRAMCRRGSKRYREKFPERYKARRKSYYAVHSGKLSRPTTCSWCRKECKPEGHHADYSKPLEVKWLCGKCHRHIHRLTTMSSSDILVHIEF